MRVADLVLGLRCNDATTLDIARVLLADHVVEGFDAGPNVSMWIAPVEADAPTRELHRLYRRGATVLRTRSLQRVVHASVAMLESFGPVPEGLLELDARLLVRDGRAVLVSDPHGFAVDALHERRLRRFGWHLTDVVRPRLDPDTLQIAIAAPTLRLTASGLERLTALDPDSEANPVLSAPGRYPLDAVLSVTFFAPNDVATQSRAARVVSLGKLPHADGARLTVGHLEVVRRVVDQVPVHHLSTPDTKAILDVLDSVA